MSRLWLVPFVLLTVGCGADHRSPTPPNGPAAVPSAPTVNVTVNRATTVGIRVAVLETITRVRGSAINEAPALQIIAQAVADEALAGTLKWPEVLPALKARVKAKRPISGGFGVGATKVLDPKNVDAARMKHAVDPKNKHLGLAVVSGTVPGDAKPHHIVVYVAAEALRTFGQDASDVCIGAGHTVTPGPKAPVCCAGLTAISCDRPDAKGICDAKCVGGSICAACGNGRCGNGENVCNCPADCK